MPYFTFKLLVKILLLWRHLQAFAASWKSTSVSPTLAWTGVRVKTCLAAILATAPSASQETTATSTLTSVTVPPVCTEAPALMQSTISGEQEEPLAVSVATIHSMKPLSTSVSVALLSASGVSVQMATVGACVRSTLMSATPTPAWTVPAAWMDWVPSPVAVSRGSTGPGVRQVLPALAKGQASPVARLASFYAQVAWFLFNLLFVALLEMSSAFNLDFEVSGIHGYVMMDGVMPSLTEITCTFWMKSSDTTNYGTPVSYAVEGSDNAFLLIDYNGSVTLVFVCYWGEISDGLHHMKWSCWNYTTRKKLVAAFIYSILTTSKVWARNKSNRNIIWKFKLSFIQSSSKSSSSWAQCGQLRPIPGVPNSKFTFLTISFLDWKWTHWSYFYLLDFFNDNNKTAAVSTPT